MCRVDDASRRRAVRRQTAFRECEPRASAHAGSRAGSFRVLAGPGTTAGRSLSSRASSLASLLSFFVDAGRCGKVTKNLGLPCCASASNVPSLSHCCWTWASSLRRASLRVLDLGGAGGVAMVSRAFFMLANWRGALCVTARWRVAQAQRWRARKRLSVICSNCRRDLCSQAQAMQPADCDRLQKLAAASVLQTLARFRSSIPQSTATQLPKPLRDYAVERAAPKPANFVF